MGIVTKAAWLANLYRIGYKRI